MSNARSDSTTDGRINAVAKSFTIIEHLQEHGRCGVSELAADLDLPKSTAHVYLSTLTDLGYVVAEDGEYRLGLRFLELGGSVRRDHSVYQIARSEIDAVTQSTGEVGTIGYEEDGLRVLVYRSEPVEGVSDNAPTGEFTRTHWTAVGKALLSQHSDDEVRAIADRHGLPAATENTVTDVDRLVEEVSAIRSRGYAVEDEERVEGVKSVAVPVAGGETESGNSAISIAGPKHRFSSERIEDELLPELRNAANVIELTSKHY